MGYKKNVTDAFCKNKMQPCNSLILSYFSYWLQSYILLIVNREEKNKRTFAYNKNDITFAQSKKK